VQGEGNREAACVDGETLAAWADGGLRPAEAATVEQHLSECTRCQAILATFVQTAPTAPVAESLWHRWRLPWLVPLATAATAVALWVAIPRNQTVPTVPDATREDALPTQEKLAPTTSIGALEQRQDVAQLESRVARADESQGRARAAADPDRAPPAPAKTLEADQKTDDARASGRLAAAPTAAATAAAPGERNERALSARQVLAPAEIISPNPANRWRIVAGGQVERSTTGGAQWEPASVPAAATLTAGASPAPSVCWIVGRAGAVYLTTDGLSFMRLPFSERTDLIAVQATDDRRATVTSTDGRTFRTDDQGATWTRATP